ncbi:alpha-amylase family glycosyl hydrolase [Kocuria sp. CPCC 205263]|uniref:alpha-amylase family glycosyl hydrolase n=1 Tax=Kocuria sp. CPCC 205263 TaxID=3073555 RepID=UPI0034D760A3
MITVRFQYITGIKQPLFRNARLCGSWNAWAEIPMREIVTEDPDPHLVRPERTAVIPANGEHVTARYRMTVSRYLGAQKYYQDGNEGIRFAVWAPHAQSVDVVFGLRDNGYIDDDGRGIDPDRPIIALHETTGGVWASAAQPDFSTYVGLPYMYRLRTAQGAVKYRTDIHSRWQIGRGDINPEHAAWDGDPHTLDGGVSCSVVIDQDLVREEFEPTTDPPRQLADEEFWASEFTQERPVSTRLTELVIYELHIGSWGYGRTGPGNLQDAMDLIPYLVCLGVNAVELMPVSETGGVYSWGYGDTHHFVIESSAGGRDKYKHFVRECHRNGIAVIQDVVYNHFDNQAERAQWQYDSDRPEQNIYYWYEGDSTSYPTPEGGYFENGSSGAAPRYWEENVRQLFTSSAAEFAEEFHVDGFRVDLTEAIHGRNELNGTDIAVGRANLYGQKLLREWSRTLHLVCPTTLRIAEDHSGWWRVTEPTDSGGLEFNATWFSAFYYDLIGDASDQGDKARVLHRAGFGTDDPVL